MKIFQRKEEVCRRVQVGLEFVGIVLGGIRGKG